MMCVCLCLSCKSKDRHEWVDLGLSVKWATCNVGAENSEDFGDYFAWGETDTYYKNGFAQSDEPQWKDGKTEGYEDSSYKYFVYDDEYGCYLLVKYCNNEDYGYRVDFRDNKTTLEPEDDVAHVIWGGSWRMPTLEEFKELMDEDNCSWIWTTQNGINGYNVTSKKPGYEGRSIFLPTAGYFEWTDLYETGTDGYYWSSSLYTNDPNFAINLVFEADDSDDSEDSENWFGPYGCLRILRTRGLSVRPVCP